MYENTPSPDFRVKYGVGGGRGSRQRLCLPLVSGFRPAFQEVLYSWSPIGAYSSWCTLTNDHVFDALVASVSDRPLVWVDRNQASGMGSSLYPKTFASRLRYESFAPFLRWLKYSPPSS